ncbi:universal stress protein [Actinokineospora sp. 24-640]
MTAPKKTAPAIEVTSELPEGTPVPLLLRASRSAALVVLGSRGLGGFSGLLVGSSAVQVAAHACVPVVVVHGGGPGERTARGDVVVGVDGSAHSADAIAFAFGEARRLGTGLLAVSVAPVGLPAGELPADDARTARALAEAMAGWAEKYPEVPVRRDVVVGHPARTLTDLAAGAAMLVVGSRGAGGFRGLLLGSVSQAVLHHATCPVAIVRTEA